MTDTKKDKWDNPALSKNNGKSVRYRKRLEEEREAKKEQEEALKRLYDEEDTYRNDF